MKTKKELAACIHCMCTTKCMKYVASCGRTDVVNKQCSIDREIRRYMPMCASLRGVRPIRAHKRRVHAPIYLYNESDPLESSVQYCPHVVWAGVANWPCSFPTLLKWMQMACSKLIRKTFHQRFITWRQSNINNKRIQAQSTELWRVWIE